MDYLISKLPRNLLPIILLIDNIGRAIFPGLLGVILAVFMVVGGNESILKDAGLMPLLYKLHLDSTIISGLGIGGFASWAVWFFSVYRPEKKRKKIIKDHLTLAYKEFKEKLLHIFLYCVNEVVDMGLAGKLHDYREFQKYFNNERWMCVFNQLGNDDNNYLSEIHQHMEIFCREAMYVRYKCDIYDARVHNFLVDISNLALEYKQINTNFGYEDRKALLRYFWWMFTQWNIITGQHRNDPIKVMIKRI